VSSDAQDVHDTNKGREADQDEYSNLGETCVRIMENLPERPYNNADNNDASKPNPYNRSRSPFIRVHDRPPDGSIARVIGS
jgi:hypothetical protein